MGFDLAALLGLAGGGQTGGLASLPTPPPQEPQTPDIQVSGNRIDPAKIHELFKGGTFQTGRTGGNILGILGDAFLAQAGRGPVYAPKLQQKRDSEALENFSSDPLGALQRLTMTNPGAALPAFNQYYDNQRADKVTDAGLLDKSEGREDAARNAVGSMLYGANEKTFPTVLARAKAFAARRGLDVSDLPNTWEEARGWATGTVPVDKQEAIEGLGDYRSANLERMTAADRARAAYYGSTVAERRRSSQAREVIARDRADDYDRSVTYRGRAVDKAPDRSKWTQPQPRAAGGAATGASFVWDPAQNKYVKK